jgi:hypothetical protein
MDAVWLSRVVLSSINLALLVILISLFIKKYRTIRSEFTLGLLLFSLALFFRTLFSAPLINYFVFGSTVSLPVDPYRLIADVFELIALTIFIYIATR